MDWDKANFQKISQRKAESRRWETRDEKDTQKPARKGSHQQPSKKKKRKK